MDEQQILEFYLENDILISPELLTELKSLKLPIHSEFSVINKEILSAMDKKIPIDVRDFEKAVVLKEKHKNMKMYSKFIEYIYSGIDKKDSGTDKQAVGVS